MYILAPLGDYYDPYFINKSLCKGNQRRKERTFLNDLTLQDILQPMKATETPAPAPDFRSSWSLYAIPCLLLR